MSRLDEQNQNNYHLIYFRTIRPKTRVPFDILIKSDNVFEVCIEKGSIINEEDFKKLADNNTIAHIKNSDRNLYKNYISQNIFKILKDQNFENQKRAEIAHMLLTNTAEHLFEELNEKYLNLFISAVSAVADFILNDKEAIYNLMRLTKFEFKVSTHSVNVGIFATGLAKISLDINNHFDMRNIASGFFIHDIGISKVPFSILTKPTPLAYNEWIILKKHPSEGQKILNKFNVLTDEISTIVMQHHERRNGRGYPLELRGNKIHVYSKICSIADAFEAMTTGRPYKKAISSFEAIMTIKKEMTEEFDPKLLKQFILLLSNARMLVKN